MANRKELFAAVATAARGNALDKSVETKEDDSRRYEGLLLCVKRHLSRQVSR